MSIRLRIKYKYRSIEQVCKMMWRHLTLPAFLTGKMARVVLGALVVTTAVGYAFQVNTLSTSGYQIHTLEKQMAGLQTELQTLNTDIAAAQSLTNIQKRLAGTGLLPGSSAVQLKPTGEVVVAQR